MQADLLIASDKKVAHFFFFSRSIGRARVCAGRVAVCGENGRSMLRQARERANSTNCLLVRQRVLLKCTVWECTKSMQSVWMCVWKWIGIRGVWTSYGGIQWQVIEKKHWVTGERKEIRRDAFRDIAGWLSMHRLWDGWVCFCCDCKSLRTCKAHLGDSFKSLLVGV